MQYKILCKKMKLNFNDTGHLGMVIFFILHSCENDRVGKNVGGNCNSSDNGMGKM